MAKPKIFKLKVTRVRSWPMEWDGDISRIKTECLSCSEVIGAKIGEDKYLVETGAILRPARTCIIEEKRTRLPQGIKDVFFDIAEKYQRKQELESQMAQINAELMSIQRDFQDLPNRIQKAKGFLTDAEFNGAFFDALTLDMKKAMKQRGYFIGECCGIPYTANAIHISREVLFQKYFRKASFLYEEYDGNIFLRDDAEKDPNYQSILKGVSALLPTCAKCEETLFIGDKSSLHYGCMYTIPLKQPKTKEYAKSLARQFCGQ